MKKSSNERKKRKENWKNGEGTESLEAERRHWDIINMMIDWTPNITQYDDTSATTISSTAISSFAIPAGQPQYYHQFLVPPGLQMPPPGMIPPIRNAQGEERMEIPRTSMGTQPPQGPPSTGNPDYISPLKREHSI
uniref:Uncharacterized protein n=1 Tax=Romanomermis culicivorax TaxID=13658 RepID=A0A915HXQ2_ROMCU